jgi:hypothetical protein
MSKINILKRLKGYISTDANKFMKVNSAGNNMSFGGILDNSVTVSLVAGYNNDFVIPANANHITVNGVFGIPAILTGILRTGNYNGEIITLRSGGATFFIGTNHLKEASALGNSILASGASTADTVINYVPVCRGQQAVLYYSTAVNRWILMNATELIYTIPFKKGVSYIQQAQLGSGQIGNLSSLSNGVGASIGGNGTPGVGINQSLSIMTTGTTLTGRASILSGGGSSSALQQFALGQNLMEVNFLFVIETLSTALESFTIRVGLLNAHTAPTVGIWAEYTDSVNGGRWTLNCNNGGTKTTVNSTVLVGAAAAQMLSIVWNGTEAKLIIGSNVLATLPIGSNFPTTQGCTPMLTIEKTLGITARRVYFSQAGFMRVESTL